MASHVYPDKYGYEHIYEPNPTAEYEALGFDGVVGRIRDEHPDLKPDDHDILARAVMTLLPPPGALGEYLRKATADLEGICGFLRESLTMDAHTYFLTREYVEHFQQTLTLVEDLRDRFKRVCQGDTSVDGNEDQAGSGQTGRMVVRRSLLPKSRRDRDKSTGRGFFVYFVTELLRARGHEKIPALEVAGKIVSRFWGGEGVSYNNDIARNEAYDAGRRKGRDRGFAEVDDFVHWIAPMTKYQFMLAWVPVRRSTR